MSQLVTIIMPVFNGEEFIANAIKSVIDQTYSNWELVVIDDGSKDGTSSVVEAFDDPRISYTYQENRGQAAALNRGLELAHGKYITTLDADDWMPPNSLLDRVDYLECHQEFGAVYGDGYYCNSSGKPFLRFSEYCPEYLSGDIYNVLIISNLFATGAAVMIRREFIESDKMRYDESIAWCQDWDFYIRLAEKAIFGCIDTSTVHYRIHDTNMTLALPNDHRLDSLVRMKSKVMESARFADVPDNHKTMFFYDLLIQVLKGQVEEQTRIFGSPQFQKLPNQQQADLMRYAAIEYLIRGENIEQVKNWLKSAWLLSYLNLKTCLVIALTTININLARLVVIVWRGAHAKRHKISPFTMVETT